MWIITKDLMNLLSLPEPVVESSADIYLIGEPSAPWRSSLSVPQSSRSDKKTATFRLSQSGMTYQHLTVNLGAEKLMSYLVDSPALSQGPLSLQNAGGSLLNKLLQTTTSLLTKEGGVELLRQCVGRELTSGELRDLDSLKHLQLKSTPSSYLKEKGQALSLLKSQTLQQSIGLQWYSPVYLSQINTVKIGGGLLEDTLLMAGELTGKEEKTEESSFLATTANPKSSNVEYNLQDLTSQKLKSVHVTSTTSQKEYSTKNLNSLVDMPTGSTSTDLRTSYLLKKQELYSMDTCPEMDNAIDSKQAQQVSHCAWICVFLQKELEPLYRWYATREENQRASLKEEFAINVIFICSDWATRIFVDSLTVNISTKELESSKELISFPKFTIFLLTKTKAMLQTELLSTTVRTSALQEREPELKESEADYGVSLRESSVKYDPSTHSWKTVQLLGQEDLPESSVTLPKSGMMLSGQLWELTRSELPTSVKESGSSRLTPGGQTFFHTPTCGGLDGGSNSRKALRKRAEFLTPQASDAKRSLFSLESLAKRWKKHPNGNLAEQIAMFPTPRTKGMCGGTGSMEQMKKLEAQGVITEEERKKMTAGNGGALNPEFVAWLMAFPIGWTDLKPLEMHKFLLWRRQLSKCLKIF